MKQLIECIQFLLIEGRLEDLRSKYPDIDINEIWEADPSPTKKYVEWMAKKIDGGEAARLELFQTIDFFDKRKNKFKSSDINRYKSFEDLLNDADRVKKEFGELSGRKQRELNKLGAEVIQDEETFTVYRIDTKEAAVAYGKNTKWCITQADEDHYENYIKRDVIFYYLISKSPLPQIREYEKIAISVEREQNVIEFFDSLDENIRIYGIKKIFNKFDLLKIKEDAKVQPLSVYSQIKNGSVDPKELAKVINSAQEDGDIYRTLLDYVNGYSNNNDRQTREARLTTIRNIVAPLINDSLWGPVLQNVFIPNGWSNIHTFEVRNLPEEYPNVLDTNGYRWFKNPRPGDLPGLISWDGIVKKWFDENMELHRDGDKPAIDGSYRTEWFKHGKMHRVNGPAFLNYSQETAFYYLDGVRMSKEEWEKERKNYAD